MSEPIISIIIPVYNALLYLPRCIYSIVLLQDCIDKIEVILVDDASTDGVDRYIDLLAEKYSFVKAIHFEENSGTPVRGRNAGLREARGEYVFFCDNDDHFAPHALDKMIEHVLEWRPDIMLAKVNSTTGRDYPKSMFAATNPDVDVYYSTVSRTVGPWKLWRRKFLLDNGIEFPNASPEDNPFTLKAYLLAKKVSIAADQDYYFFENRPDGGNASNPTSAAAKLYRQAKLLYNAAVECLRIYKQYADPERGKRYMLPRQLNTLAKLGFRGLLFADDADTAQKEKWILHIKELLLSVCNDREYLRSYETANIGEYVLLSALMDYSGFDQAKELALKLQNKEWQELESGEGGCIYSLGGFRFDARHFLEFSIDVKGIRYSGLDELVISGNAALKNFQPEIIYGSKAFLKATDGGDNDRVEFAMEPVKKADGYAFKARLDLKAFEEGVERLNLQDKRWRWDVWISIGGVKAARLPIDINAKTALFTAFAGFIEANEKYALLPHVSGGGLLCFWHFGKETKAATADFLRKMPDRPLVNELAVRMIEKKDFASLRKLAKDARGNGVAAKTVAGGGAVYYNGKKYSVDSYAHLEARLCALKASNSWKLTAPLRKMAGLAKRGRK